MVSEKTVKVPRLEPETLARYFQAPNTVVHLLSAHPHCELHVDPIRSCLELHVQGDGTIPKLDRFENINLQLVDDNPNGALCISISTLGNNFAVYTFIAQVVDNIHNGEAVALAIESSIEQYQTLLFRRGILSVEKQVGLTGELLLLRWLIETLPDQALQAWLGPQAEQHDFAFGLFDVEVKTTTSEKRAHRIGSATQLSPNRSRQLWLLSLQITSAGLSEDSFSLESLINDIHALLEPSSSSQFEAYLENLGWRHEDTASYQRRFLLRSRPATFKVEGVFPAIRVPDLIASVPSFELISDLSYRIDVSTYPPDTPPVEIEGFSTDVATTDRGSS
ncbi:PD-(D/E)XK motif protein [Arthrobacter rhombi]|uniref:PD-(D/E)XK motif protein n=1 Tax=Arthrobacter rhombi TaxID=71253 RepID=UPI003FCF2F39